MIDFGILIRNKPKTQKDLEVIVENHSMYHTMNNRQEETLHSSKEKFMNMHQN